MFRVCMSAIVLLADDAKKREDCILWAQAGECENNRPYMEKECSQACGKHYEDKSGKSDENERQEKARLKEKQDKETRLKEEQEKEKARLKEEQEKQEKARLKEKQDKETRLKEEQEKEKARLKEEQEKQEKARLKEEQEKARLKEEQEKQEKARLKEEQEKARLKKEQEKVSLKEKQEKEEQEKQEKARLKEEQEKQEKARLKEEQEKEDEQEKARLKEKQEKQEKARLKDEQEKEKLKDEQEKARLKEEQEKARLKVEHEKVSLKVEHEKVSLKEEEEKEGLKEEQEKVSLKEEQEPETRLKEEEEKEGLKVEREKVSLKEEEEKEGLKVEQGKVSLKEEQEKARLKVEHEKVSLKEEQELETRLKEEEEKEGLEEEQDTERLKEEQEEEQTEVGKKDACDDTNSCALQAISSPEEMLVMDTSGILPETHPNAARGLDFGMYSKLQYQGVGADSVEWQEWDRGTHDDSHLAHEFDERIPADGEHGTDMGEGDYNEQFQNQHVDTILAGESHARDPHGSHEAEVPKQPSPIQPHRDHAHADYQLKPSPDSSASNHHEAAHGSKETEVPKQPRPIQPHRDHAHADHQLKPSPDSSASNHHEAAHDSHVSHETKAQKQEPRPIQPGRDHASASNRRVEAAHEPLSDLHDDGSYGHTPEKPSSNFNVDHLQRGILGIVEVLFILWQWWLVLVREICVGTINFIDSHPPLTFITMYQAVFLVYIFFTRAFRKEDAPKAKERIRPVSYPSGVSSVPSVLDLSAIEPKFARIEEMQSHFAHTVQQQANLTMERVCNIERAMKETLQRRDEVDGEIIESIREILRWATGVDEEESATLSLPDTQNERGDVDTVLQSKDLADMTRNERGSFVERISASSYRRLSNPQAKRRPVSRSISHLSEEGDRHAHQAPELIGVPSIAHDINQQSSAPHGGPHPPVPASYTLGHDVKAEPSSTSGADPLGPVLPPSNAHHAPSNTYNALSNTHNAPTNTYSVPSNTHTAPDNTHNAPSNTYNAPSGTGLRMNPENFDDAISSAQTSPRIGISPSPSPPSMGNVRPPGGIYRPPGPGRPLVRPGYDSSFQASSSVEAPKASSSVEAPVFSPLSESEFHGKLRDSVTASAAQETPGTTVPPRYSADQLSGPASADESSAVGRPAFGAQGRGGARPPGASARPAPQEIKASSNPFGRPAPQEIKASSNPFGPR